MHQAYLCLQIGQILLGLFLVIFKLLLPQVLFELELHGEELRRTGFKIIHHAEHLVLPLLPLSLFGLLCGDLTNRIQVNRLILVLFLRRVGVSDRLLDWSLDLLDGDYFQGGDLPSLVVFPDRGRILKGAEVLGLL